MINILFGGLFFFASLTSFSVKSAEVGLRPLLDYQCDINQFVDEIYDAGSDLKLKKLPSNVEFNALLEVWGNEVLAKGFLKLKALNPHWHSALVEGGYFEKNIKVICTNLVKSWKFATTSDVDMHIDIGTIAYLFLIDKYATNKKLDESEKKLMVNSFFHENFHFAHPDDFHYHGDSADNDIVFS